MVTNATNSSSLAVIDAANNAIAGLDSLWVWSVAIGTLLYAAFDHKDTLNEYKEANGWKKRGICLKLVLLWMLPVVGLIGAYSASLRDAREKAAYEAIEISPEKERFLLEAFAESPKGKIATLVYVGDAPAVESKDRLIALFKKAGFEIAKDELQMVPFTLNGEPISITGLQFQVHNARLAPAHSAIVATAFRDAGFKYAAGENDRVEDGHLRVLVGSPPYAAAQRK
jgi:hypothetical protein